MNDIDHIITNTFSIGCFGRSGSRTIAEFLTSYYTGYQLASKKWRYLFDADKLKRENPQELDVVKKIFNGDKHLKKMLEFPFLPHHTYSITSYENFNNNEGIKILVLRNPIERAKSGQSKSFSAHFHGAPALHKVNFDKVDYIIDFNKLSDYTPETHLGKIDVDVSPDSEFIESLKGYSYPENLSDIYESWEVEDYNYEEDIEIYNNVLETKEHLPVDLWKNLVRNHNEINIPTTMHGKRYKKWDM